MEKFQKRLLKTKKNPQNAIVLGEGFGHLEDILEVFKSVFVFAPTAPKIKAKNLIFREHGAGKDFLNDISVVFVDRDKTKKIDDIVIILNKWHSLVVIEGDEVIGRDLSQTLYRTGYGAVEQQGYYHTWKKLK